MSYTDEEICKFYRNGSNLLIVQELTCRSKKEIISILERNGYEVKKTRSTRKKYNDEDFIELYNKGLNNAQMSREIGCSECTVSNWIKEKELIPNYKKIKKPADTGK